MYKFSKGYANSTCLSCLISPWRDLTDHAYLHIVNCTSTANLHTQLPWWDNKILDLFELDWMSTLKLTWSSLCGLFSWLLTYFSYSECGHPGQRVAMKSTSCAELYHCHLEIIRVIHTISAFSQIADISEHLTQKANFTRDGYQALGLHHSRLQHR